MQYHFTPGAERALAFASAWSDDAACDELEALPLLVGLLSEPECRAATFLATRGINLTIVRRRWPNLKERPSSPDATRAKSFSNTLKLALELARQRLAAFPRPLEMATEHLLLGLLLVDAEVSVWLCRQGLDADTLAAEIYRLYGYERDDAAEEAEPLGPLGNAQNADPSDAYPAAPGAVEDAGTTDATTRSATATLRAFDAAANRAREGLRVIEDCVRFVLDDRHLTDLCKRLRHDLTAVLRRVAPQDRLAARETQADVGTELSTVSEQSRAGASDLLAANFARLQESLRSLEEFGKLIEPGLAEGFKQLRYRAYTLHRAVEITHDSCRRLADARLYVLIDGRPSVEEFDRLVGSLIEASVDVLQLRDKQLDDRTLLDRARRLRAATQGTATLFIMNDRPDLAVLAQADGVHVGQEELSIKDVRAIVGPAMLIGVSTHSIQQARQAVLDGANYLGVGPTFPSDTKAFDHFPGVGLLRAVAAEIRLPAFAIGGIDRDHVGQVLDAGFTRIAVSRAVTGAKDPSYAANELHKQLLEGNRVSA